MSIKLLAAGDGWFKHRIMARGGGCKIHVLYSASASRRQKARVANSSLGALLTAIISKRAHASRLLTSECCRNSRRRRELGLVATLMKNAHLGGINLAHQLYSVQTNFSTLQMCRAFFLCATYSLFACTSPGQMKHGESYLRI